MIRTLIVDDEEPARDRLRQLLQAFDQVFIVGEARDGEEACQKILEIRPDLVFLDIQMPVCSGLEVASSLPSPPPAIIFCTAYDQYAVDAFELHAVDYLLKPVSRTRLTRALERFQQEKPSDREHSLHQALQALPPTRFLAKKGARYVVIQQEEVCCFQSEEGLTKLCTADQHYWIDPTLNDLEDRLPAQIFFRISRSATVRLDAVREVIPMIGGSGEVLLKNGIRLEVSRRRFRDLLESLGS